MISSNRLFTFGGTLLGAVFGGILLGVVIWHKLKKMCIGMLNEENHVVRSRQIKFRAKLTQLPMCYFAGLILSHWWSIFHLFFIFFHFHMKNSNNYA